jgi:probable phosphoglycerate mutase
VPDLVEVSLGEWEGGEFRIRMAEGDPIAIQAVAEERWEVIPGAETMEALAQRVHVGVQAWSRSRGPTVTVAAFVPRRRDRRSLPQATESRPFRVHPRRQRVADAARVLPGGRWLLRSFNDTAHLPAAA